MGRNQDILDIDPIGKSACVSVGWQTATAWFAVRMNSRTNRMSDLGGRDKSGCAESRARTAEQLTLVLAMVSL